MRANFRARQLAGKKTPPEGGVQNSWVSVLRVLRQPCFWTKPILIMLAFFAAARTLARTP